ncbi:MAG: adenylate/guanylate cyclase domain-containing protein [Alphaproteobacteria bacterium]
MRTALIGLLLLTGIATAALVNITWSNTANRHVRNGVGELNAQIVGSIKEELTIILKSATAAREALRTVFFQRVIAIADEAKREFVFLALLQSQPSLSWISFGWPDGAFFGAQKVEDDRIRMVEIVFDRELGITRRRVDYYDVLPGDIEFKDRRFTDSGFDATKQPWYRRAAERGDPIWSEVDDFPTRVRPAIATSVRLTVDEKFVGVINVVIEHERLSRFLSTIRVGQAGSAYIIAADGRIVAAPMAKTALPLPEEELPPARRLDSEADPLLAVAAKALREAKLNIGEIAQTRQLEVVDESGRAFFVSFSPLEFQGWVVATVVPADEFLGEFERSERMVLAAVALFVGLVVIFGIAVSQRLLLAPIRQIAGQLRYVEQFRLEEIKPIRSSLRELRELSATLGQMGKGLGSFRKFLPTELVRLLVSQGVEARPGGERRILSILFSDLAGFTRLSEQLGDKIVPLLADYLSRMTQIIQAQGGTVDKFIGDAVMAFWGAPLDDRAHALNACRTALACQAMLREFRRRGAFAGSENLHMRLGINTGDVLVGNIGSDERLNYTAIGDPVNVASRLEAINKRYGTEIVIGEDTRLAAGDDIVVRRLDTVAVYGRAGGIGIYELLGLASDRAKLGALDWVAHYEAGLAAYRARDWDAAIGWFERTIAVRGGTDPASALFIRQCREFQANPPESGWDGLSVMNSK